jgi:hypothetical protein
MQYIALPEISLGKAFFRMFMTICEGVPCLLRALTLTTIRQFIWFIFKMLSIGLLTNFFFEFVSNRYRL